MPQALLTWPSSKEIQAQAEVVQAQAEQAFLAQVVWVQVAM